MSRSHKIIAPPISDPSMKGPRKNAFDPESLLESYDTTLEDYEPPRETKPAEASWSSNWILIAAVGLVLVLICLLVYVVTGKNSNKAEEEEIRNQIEKRGAPTMEEMMQRRAQQQYMLQMQAQQAQQAQQAALLAQQQAKKKSKSKQKPKAKPKPKPKTGHKSLSEAVTEELEKQESSGGEVVEEKAILDNINAQLNSDEESEDDDQIDVEALEDDDPVAEEPEEVSE